MPVRELWRQGPSEALRQPPGPLATTARRAFLPRRLAFHLHVNCLPPCEVPAHSLPFSLAQDGSSPSGPSDSRGHLLTEPPPVHMRRHLIIFSSQSVSCHFNCLTSREDCEGEAGEIPLLTQTLEIGRTETHQGLTRHPTPVPASNFQPGPLANPCGFGPGCHPVPEELLVTKPDTPLQPSCRHARHCSNHSHYTDSVHPCSNSPYV